MVEVDPMLLIAAGSIAAGLAAAALCLRAPVKTEKIAVVARKNETKEVSKPKKKVTKSVKKSSANDSAADSESEIAALIADIGHVDLQQKSIKKSKDSKSSGPSPADIAATKATAKKQAELEEIALKAQRKAEAAEEAAQLVATLLAEEEDAKKGKKAKESPEQRVARLERQKLAKVKKVEEEELSKSVAIKVAAVESKLVSSHSNSAGGGSAASAQHVDGWAVVEDKRKVKAKVPVPVVAESSGPTDPTQPSDYTTQEVKVDSKKIGVIIGPKGVTLHGIQDATGVTINTPKGERDNAAPSIMISVTGPAEGVSRAVKAINELCSKGYSKLLAGDDFKEGGLEVLPIYLSEIIGKGGANIRAIQDATGVKLSIPQVARDHALPVKITIAGTKDKVQAAKDIITELLTYFHTSVTHPGQIHVEMDVPVIMYNYIIGSRGSEIKHIQGNFKVSVHIPNAESVVKNIIIVGDPQGVKNAEKYILKIIDQAIADKEHAEKMADSWVDGVEEEEGHESWMDQYSHPSRKVQKNENTSILRSIQPGSSENSFKIGAASSAAVAASASAWGANVLASSEGW